MQDVSQFLSWKHYCFCTLSNAQNVNWQLFKFFKLFHLPNALPLCCHPDRYFPWSWIWFGLLCFWRHSFKFQRSSHPAILSRLRLELTKWFACMPNKWKGCDTSMGVGGLLTRLAEGPCSRRLMFQVSAGKSAGRLWSFGADHSVPALPTLKSDE